MCDNRDGGGGGKPLSNLENGQSHHSQPNDEDDLINLASSQDSLDVHRSHGQLYRQLTGVPQFPGQPPNHLTETPFVPQQQNYPHMQQIPHGVQPHLTQQQHAMVPYRSSRPDGSEIREELLAREAERHRNAVFQNGHSGTFQHHVSVVEGAGVPLEELPWPDNCNQSLRLLEDRRWNELYKHVPARGKCILLLLKELCMRDATAEF